MPYCWYIELKETTLKTFDSCCYKRIFLIGRCIIVGFLCTSFIFFSFRPKMAYSLIFFKNSKLFPFPWQIHECLNQNYRHSLFAEVWKLDKRYRVSDLWYWVRKWDTITEYGWNTQEVFQPFFSSHSFNRRESNIGRRHLRRVLDNGYWLLNIEK